MPAVFVYCWPCYMQMLRYCRQPCRVPCFSMLRRWWSCWRCFGVVLQYSARNGHNAPRIGGRVAAGGVSARVGVSFVPDTAAGPPPPQAENAKTGLPFQKIFLFFIFLHL